MAYDVGHIAAYTAQRVNSHKKERKRRLKLTKDERIHETQERKRIKRAAGRYIDATAVEDNFESDNLQRAEKGYYKLVRDLIPRDPTTGRPFIIVLGKRLVRVTSDRWWDLNEKQQRFIRRKTRRYQAYLRNYK